MNYEQRENILEIENLIMYFNIATAELSESERKINRS